MYHTMWYIEGWENNEFDCEPPPGLVCSSLDKNRLVLSCSHGHVHEIRGRNLHSYSAPEQSSGLVGKGKENVHQSLDIVFAQNCEWTNLTHQHHIPVQDLSWLTMLVGVYDQLSDGVYGLDENKCRIDANVKSVWPQQDSNPRTDITHAFAPRVLTRSKLVLWATGFQSDAKTSRMIKNPELAYKIWHQRCYNPKGVSRKDSN